MGGCAPAPACPRPLDGGCGNARHFDVATYGFDPALCGVSTSPDNYGVPLQDGLRVPQLPSSSPNTRYLFQLATVGLPGTRVVKIQGISQLLTIWSDTANSAANQVTPSVLPVAVTEQLVGGNSGNPVWHPPDANVSWHMRMVRSKPTRGNNQNILNADSFAHHWSDTPACIFDTATFNAANLDGNGRPDNYLALTGYTAPSNGVVPGTNVVAELGTFYGIRYPWQSPAYFTEPIEVCGPGWLVLYASVWQTNNSGTRSTIAVPASFPLATMQPEDAFATAYTSYIYGRVGGRLIVEV